jgi:hypothetical protein
MDSCALFLLASARSKRAKRTTVRRPPPEQAKAALQGYSAYFGTYSVNERTATVTHHSTGNINPGDMGDFVRHVEFRDNLLILRSETNSVITWDRQVGPVISIRL